MLTMTLGFLFVTSVAASQDVTLKVSVPKEVAIQDVTIPGGAACTFRATVTIKNSGNSILPFSRHSLDFKIVQLDGKDYPEYFWGWDKPLPNELDQLVIQPGEEHKATANFTFHTATPKEGEKYTVKLKFNGQEAKATFKVKKGP